MLLRSAVRDDVNIQIEIVICKNRLCELVSYFKPFNNFCIHQSLTRIYHKQIET